MVVSRRGVGVPATWSPAALVGGGFCGLVISLLWWGAPTPIRNGRARQAACFRRPEAGGLRAGGPLTARAGGADWVRCLGAGHRTRSRWSLRFPDSTHCPPPSPRTQRSSVGGAGEGVRRADRAEGGLRGPGGVRGVPTPLRSRRGRLTRAEDPVPRPAPGPARVWAAPTVLAVDVGPVSAELMAAWWGRGKSFAVFHPPPPFAIGGDLCGNGRSVITTAPKCVRSDERVKRCRSSGGFTGG